MHYFSYNENKQHGTSDFPVAYYYVNQEHPSYTMPFHWHREWEIIRVLEGTLSLSVDGHEIIAMKDDILLLREGILHGGTPLDCVYECFNFDLDSLFANVRSVRDYLRPFFRNHFLPTIHYPNCAPDVYPIVDELLSVFQDDTPESFRRLITLSNISRLFAILLQKGYYTENTKTSSDTTDRIAQLKPVLEYIETHFSENLSLTELSGIIGMNPKYFCRFFSSLTRQTPMNYVNYYRIEQAATMLSTTNMTVTEIGMECGFNDTCHFVKTFKKQKGLTPKQYQKKSAIQS